MQKFDAIIIGSGQAGTPLVFKMSDQGKKVAFIEKQHLGGTCLNVGCTPTKTYVASARRIWDAANGEALGVMIPKGAYVDMKQVKARKDILIKKSVDSITANLDKTANITYFKGEATFIGHKQLVVGDVEMTAEQIFINVGAQPAVPKEFEGLPYLTNESMLELEEVPEHLVIIGGSYIGLEFGQMFRRFGSRVTIIEKSDTIIKGEDQEVSDTILQFLKEEGIEFRLQATCISGEKEPDGRISIQVDCKMGGASKVKGTHLLLAIGRKPNTDQLNLEKTGVAVDKHGYIAVDDYLQTNVPGIYALGDCNGKGAFTHTAYNDYEIVAENMFDGKHRKVSDRITTYGLFIDPPLGRAGLTRKEALSKGIRLLEGKMDMSSISRAKEKGETNGFMRVLIDADTKKIVGACILGVGGDEIVSSILNVMYADVTYDIIRDSVQVHPTISELIPTMLGSLEKVE